VVIQVVSGSVRLVSDTCGISSVAGTTAGLAYIRSCGGSSSLHLLRPTTDTVLAAQAIQAIRTPDRGRLLYAYQDPTVLPCVNYCARIVSVDLTTMVASEVTPTGAIPPEFWGGLGATNGTELLATTPLSPRFFLAPLAGGAWSEKLTAWQRPDGLRSSENVGPVVGWNSQGIWTLPEVSPLGLGEALSGRFFPLPQDAQATGTAWEGGFMAANGGAVALWRSGCEQPDHEGRYPDDCARFYYTLWLHDLTSHTNSLLAAFRLSNDYGPVGGRDWKLYMSGGSFAPDGRRVGYLMDGDVYISNVPGPSPVH
jgi:hypothetical protein